MGDRVTFCLHNMHRQLTSRVSACKARIQAECNARAQGAARAAKADFAAERNTRSHGAQGRGIRHFAAASDNVDI